MVLEGARALWRESGCTRGSVPYHTCTSTPGEVRVHTGALLPPHAYMSTSSSAAPVCRCPGPAGNEIGFV